MHAYLLDGFVPDAKRRISPFRNNLLPDFYESFKVRAGSNVQWMKRMLIAERDRQYNITVDIKQLENRLQYLLSNNPACAGRFLCDDYKPNPHDDSNITRCKNEANEIKLKLQAIKDKILKHNDSLFSENTGKLKTGLSCHHSFNNDKRYYVTSSIEKDVDRLIEDLDKAFVKYWGAYHNGSKSKTSQARKRKEQRKKIKEQEMEHFKKQMKKS